MDQLMEKIALYLEKGKIDANSPYPPELSGQDGVSELTQKAIENGIPPERILNEGLIKGMEEVGRKWRNDKLYLPDVILSAEVMKKGMQMLEPFFSSGEIKHKGDFVIGTVEGDLHDIGKNIVKMFFIGGGWKVIDVGVDKGPEVFQKAIEEHKPSAVGLSALLTTTMDSMEEITKILVTKYPGIKVIVGGAPITQEFADEIGAHAYFKDPPSALEYINANCI